MTVPARAPVPEPIQETPLPGTVAPRLALQVKIWNIYEHDTVITFCDALVTAPDDLSDHDALNEWAVEELFELTGTGRTEGNSCYELKIIRCTEPGLVGRTFEFG